MTHSQKTAEGASKAIFDAALSLIGVLPPWLTEGSVLAAGGVARLVFAAAPLAGAVAFAEEPPAADAGASVVETANTPEVIVIGFEDVSSEPCEPKIARYGRCVEEVRFVDHEAAWDTESDPTDLQRAEWRNTSLLYAEAWEDLSYRFTIDSDPVSMGLRGRGVTALPAAKQQWEASARDPAELDRSVYALPRSTSWLSASRWIDPRTQVPPRDLTIATLLQDTSAFFPVVRVNKAAGLVPSDPMVILKGRFAQRLAADGKRHPWDIMDGDIEASSPLFEQMYPYARGLAQEAGDNQTQIPLTRFIAEEVLKTQSTSDLVGYRKQNYADTLIPGPESSSYQVAWDIATEEFERFYRLVGTQILRFAREEYTPTHVRVLTAMVAMESPPGTLRDAYVSSSDVVAASKGQLDTEDPGIAEFRGYASSRDGFAINFVELPQELVDRHIVTMSEWKDPSADFLDLLLAEVIETLQDHLREEIVEEYQANPGLARTRGKGVDRTVVEKSVILPWVRDHLGRYRIRGLDDAYIADWIQNNSFPGRVPIVTRYFKRLALDLLVNRLDAEERERIETQILLDHLNLEIRKGFGGPDAPVATPGELEERTKEGWTGVLSLHGMYPPAIPDRSGVVDPLAICTLSDRLDALEEASFGRIKVDQLVIAPTALATAEELLWDVREQLPFIMLDDPKRNPPKVTRLVGLPGDRAVYRIRWEVWSGWHLMWGIEPLDEDNPDAPRRLALRTGAICADTVLAAPDLVPTLVRAALLDGEFRPTVPVRDVGKTVRPTKKNRSNDTTLVDIGDAQDDVDQQSATVNTAIDATTGDADAILTTASNVIDGLNYLRPGTKRTRGIDTRPVDSEAVLYVRDLFLTPLRRLDRGRPVVVHVVDHATPATERSTVWDFKPHTPYNHTQLRYVLTQDAPEKRNERVRFLHTTGWATEVEPLAKVEPLLLLSPAHIPTELENTAELKQIWRRRKTSDWHFGGGAGFFPYRFVRYSCNEAPTVDDLRRWGASVADCNKGTPLVATSETQGISLDLFALNTQWVIGDRRAAIEFGPEIHLDLLAPGRSPFYAGDVDLQDGIYYVTDQESGAKAGDNISLPTSYVWSVRFQAGVIVGVRFAPNPLHLWRSSARRYPWGAPLPDGSSSLSRFQYGLRAGFLLGPTFDGLESTVLAEAWFAWSVRFARSPQASFTPYHPAIFLGPFVRGQVGVPLGASKNLLALDYSVTAIVGLRAQFRLTQQPELKFEAPK